MTFKEWLYGLFTPPCVHHYQKVAELRDEKTPEAGVSLVQMCQHCGDTRTVEFKAPTFSCSHKYKEIAQRDIQRRMGDRTTAEIGTMFILKCEKCGEITERTVALGRDI